MELGNQIKQLRLRRGITQETLAQGECVDEIRRNIARLEKKI